MKPHFPYQTKVSPGFGLLNTIEVRLHVKGKSNIETFDFTFDTGAEITSMPVSAGIKLGINIEKCPKIKMSGFEGTTITVYKSKINLIFNKKSFILPCVFHPNERIPFLLGCAGILDKFTINLDAKKRMATFEEI